MKIEKPITKPTVTKEKKLCGCGKVAICKGMCNNCYSYQRYHSLKNAPTEGKKLCECGKPAVIKNMCQSCYQNQRYHLLKNPKIPKVKEIKTCKCGKVMVGKGMCRACYNNSFYKLDIDYTPTYRKVLGEVKKGSTISAALKFLNLNKNDFYSNITDQQKREINECKIIYNTPINSFFEDFD